MPEQNINLYAEAGSTGLTRFGGYISEEWLRDLQGVRGVKIYKEMRDNDAIVGAFLYAIEMLLRQVSWHAVKGGDSKADEEAKDFLETCLGDMASTWQETLTEILSMLPFGWAYLETVYKKRNGTTKTAVSSKYTDGRIGWAKWSIRAQETLYQWRYDDTGNGELQGMEQLPPPDYRIRYIPLEKALLFRLTSTKGNPEGRSILRNAYRSWYMKKNIEEVEAIGIERDLAGLPVVWLPPDILSKQTTDQVTAYNSWKKLITNIRRDEQEGVMMPLVYDDNNNKMYDLTLLSSGSRRQFDTSVIIGRYNQQIAMTVMADFLLLGHEGVGSFALSSNKTDLFSVALGAILDSIAGVLNTYAVPRLFALNDFGTLTALPTFEHDDIESPDLAVLGDFITKLAGAQMPLFPDEDLEEFLRTAGGLPKRPEGGVIVPVVPGVPIGPRTPKAPTAGSPTVPTGTTAEEAVKQIAKSFYDDRTTFMSAVESLQRAIEHDEDDM